MKLVQVCATDGHTCGISLFARSLEGHLRHCGLDVTTASRPEEARGAGLVLLHYHSELWSEADAVAIGERAAMPAVLFAHSEVPSEVLEVFDGAIAMCGGMASTGRPLHILPHPAWTPTHLDDRAALKSEFYLPGGRRVAGSCGFLKFERQFVELVEAVLPTVDRCGWFIDLMTSPWRLESPGLLEQLTAIERCRPTLLRVSHAFLDTPTLNRRLQACDLLWCWTAAPSSPYASGVASDLYASGSRIVAAGKMQHGHILGLPNVVSGSESFEEFVSAMRTELDGPPADRHDPTPVSWDRCARGLATFLQDVVNIAGPRRNARRNDGHADN